MTNDPAAPLPGLPQPEPEKRDLSDREVCVLNLQLAVVQLCQSALTEDPTLNPADGAGNVGTIVGMSLVGLMPPQAARLGVLVAFEAMHEKPMTVFDINRAKKALEALADRRRRADRRTAGGVIIPGKD